MQNWMPIPFDSDCPKCGAALRGEVKFCTNIDCKTWRTFGGEHIHIQCSLCKYVRTTLCKDHQDNPPRSLDEINRDLDLLVDEYNDASLLDPDFEPSRLDTEPE